MTTAPLVPTAPPPLPCRSRYARAVTFDGELYWLPLSLLAREYNRHPVIMRRWCANGFFIELGFRVLRDATGFWHIGVTESQLRTFRTLSR